MIKLNSYINFAKNSSQVRIKTKCNYHVGEKFSLKNKNIGKIVWE